MQDPGTVTRRRRSTAHSGQAGEHAQSALHKPQAGSTETWRLKHKLSTHTSWGDWGRRLAQQPDCSEIIRL